VSPSFFPGILLFVKEKTTLIKKASMERPQTRITKPEKATTA
jgi:hypothetical protein